MLPPHGACHLVTLAFRDGGLSPGALLYLRSLREVDAAFRHSFGTHYQISLVSKQ